MITLTLFFQIDNTGSSFDAFYSVIRTLNCLFRYNTHVVPCAQGVQIKVKHLKSQPRPSRTLITDPPRIYQYIVTDKIGLFTLIKADTNLVISLTVLCPLRPVTMVTRG